jgi:rhamnosyltransferase
VEPLPFVAYRVCAVIVTYHPSSGMLENMASIVAQVQGLVVVDNGSDDDEVRSLRAASRSLGFQLIENGSNLGIAAALNQGVLWAKDNDFPWVILFDQDSKITEGFVGQMFSSWESHPERERIGSMHPRYTNPETGAQAEMQRASDGSPLTSLTSGALMPAWIFDKVGLFASEYFIDLVDCEYCLRIRAAGYTIADSKNAILLHVAGQPKRVSVLGFSFQPTYHNSIRRYYITRNRLVVYRKYFGLFPRWVLRSMYESLRETIKCLVAENGRARNFRNILLGSWDGLTGKMGKREGL